MTDIVGVPQGGATEPVQVSPAAPLPVEPGTVVSAPVVSEPVAEPVAVSTDVGTLEEQKSADRSDFFESLYALEQAARAEGHTLVSILTFAARTGFGILKPKT